MAIQIRANKRVFHGGEREKDIETDGRPVLQYTQQRRLVQVYTAAAVQNEDQAEDHH